MKHFRRWMVRILVVVILVVAASLTWLWLQLRTSLPDLDGQLRLEGLASAVAIARDAAGVPTVHAGSRLDAARATGFLHAQDRFFQMDLMRRAGAGELAELLGPAVLPVDRERRLHRLREVARRALAQGPTNQLPLLAAYAEGVNAGLASLGAAPPEYLLLRAKPRPWSVEDSVLVGYTMFFTLQESDGAQERWLGVMREVLPPEAFAFFAPLGTEWDAPVDGSVLQPPPLPPANVFSFERLASGPSSADVPRQLSPGEVRKATLTPSLSHLPAPSEAPVCRVGTGRRQAGPMGEGAPRAGEDNGVVYAGEASAGMGNVEPPSEAAGSNSWAVDGQHSTSGSALVANDMHLGLTLPVIWYRLRLVCPALTPQGQPLDICGVSLPGSPLIVVGSNGHIAWSFTNAGVDTSDVVLVEVSPDDPGRYRTPEGWRAFEVHEETLRVRGGANENLRVTNTIWGPLLHSNASAHVCAVRWVAHLPEATNLGLLGFEQARDTRAAIQLAPLCGIPVMNLVVGDRDGQIGWTLCGRLPQRVGFDGRTPVSWADGTRRWEGLLTAAAYPQVSPAPEGRLWTANNRIAGSAAYLTTGPWSVDIGARARQIRDGLSPIGRASPADMLKVQLDDRAVFLDRWQRLLAATLSQPGVTNRPELAALLPHVGQWGARATPDSVGYALVREFRTQTINLVLEPLTTRCRARDTGFGYGGLQVEQPVWTILEQKPRHLLNPKYDSFDALLAKAADLACQANRADTPDHAQLRWGQRNRVAIRHPLSRAVPWLAKWLDLPPLELPGDSRMPRVQGRGFGASERLAVSPGHETEGYFHMPGGQSGHPLSPSYRAGYEAWAQGQPSPFLPGATKHQLNLIP